MATKAQWKEVLDSFIPSCIYQADEETTQAYLWGMAAVLEKIQDTLTFHQLQTFICQSTGAYTNEHGSERNLLRDSGELDFSFQQRIKNITSSASCPDIKALVDALLEVGEAIIQEDFFDRVFFNRENFYNRGDILIDPIENTFSIVIDKQIHEPYSFHSREYFMGREDFIGTNESSLELFNRIIQAVNAAKACGTSYRLIEKAG